MFAENIFVQRTENTGRLPSIKQNSFQCESSVFTVQRVNQILGHVMYLYLDFSNHLISNIFIVSQEKFL
jgi:hypothetical protein